MHKLDRQSVAIPPCLDAPPNGRRYGDLHGAEKKEIRDRLLEMQKDRCAYCERRTGQERDDGHIEHFRSQAGHEHLDLDWTNLFWSCQDEKTCGKHKDKCDRPVGSGSQALFDAGELLNPCEDAPDAFLIFISDGTVRHKDGLDAAGTRRALETLRVFQLDASPFLRRSREDAVRPYIGAIDSLMAHGVDVVREYVQSELPKIEASPFSTAVKHFLGGLLI